MNTLSLTTRSRPAGVRVPCPRSRINRWGGSCTADPLREPRDGSTTAIPTNAVAIPTNAVAIPTSAAGFTLVELLVVIGIIAALVALTVPAVMMAQRVAKNGAIRSEISQVEMSVNQYRDKYGEYPPDCAGLVGPQSTQTDPITGITYQLEARNLILRHFAKAFPRYTPGVPSGTTPTGTWAGFRADVLAGWNIDVNTLSPSTSIVFFLGGAPNWFLNSSNNPIYPGQGGFDNSKPVNGLSGFSANQANPFDRSNGHALFDFDIASLGWLNGGLAYWSKTQAVSDKTTGPMVYFRAENTNYTINGYALNLSAISNPPPVSAVDIAATNVKWCDFGGGVRVYAAVDTTRSNFKEMDKYDPNKAPVYKWVNDQSFQIFTSGLDLMYARPHINSLGIDVDCTTYPTGESYWVDPSTHATSYDDVTNFSGGTLESAIK